MTVIVPSSSDPSDAAPVSITSTRVVLVIQYLGTDYHGWQRQANHRSVQEVIESVIRDVVGYPVVVHAAGRTDAGVHAAAQVAHFDVVTRIPPHRWADILNHRLPDGIVIRGSAAVPSSWHARFSALWRRYRYTLYTDPRPNLFVRPFSWHYYYAPLDTVRMQAALSPLVGRHHLAAFHRAGSRRAHSWVDVHEAECIQRGPFVQIEIQASGFLYGMVRLLVGMLVEVGRGVRSPDDFTRLWQEQRRNEVQYAAPPQGLCLLRIGYEDDFPFSRSLWFDSQPQFLLPSMFDSGSVDSQAIPVLG
ncbi:MULTISPECIES: tRNA pseudouridine(38-40) synthase TruA [unclassified Leptolyngbya]|uniref:tRNA pseudouridine(38-40) synthase TruA n=1 Tax=unclassified Leptolyngbya TaxID=2650499 RepID=UPI0016899035|nr:MULTISPECIES: tRNA pseudouridine(38-40) synthase TruA [unclassified Leptolyngbya]MBD1909604.1 tRNA pseudouridine(38-40) synthase TruA [Leptolyngbya sp. FACHB-8]MBD2154142.1 tRNA pseudouridine(38-40) synthase TruA [Leptolyngbya sp. FACHB-16]